jgi:NADH:ubiquinone oxidoreductase subunit F (NADH-binding)
VAASALGVWRIGLAAAAWLHSCAVHGVYQRQRSDGVSIGENGMAAVSASIEAASARKRRYSFGHHQHQITTACRSGIVTICRIGHHWAKRRSQHGRLGTLRRMPCLCTRLRLLCAACVPGIGRQNREDGERRL